MNFLSEAKTIHHSDCLTQVYFFISFGNVRLSSPGGCGPWPLCGRTQSLTLPSWAINAMSTCWWFPSLSHFFTHSSMSTWWINSRSMPPTLHITSVISTQCWSCPAHLQLSKRQWPRQKDDLLQWTPFHVSPSLTWESLPLLWRFLHLLGSTRPSLPVVPISTWTPYYRQVLAMSISPFWPAVCQGPDSSNHLHYVDFHVERFYLSLRNRDMKQGLGKADV